MRVVDHLRLFPDFLHELADIQLFHRKLGPAHIPPCQEQELIDQRLHVIRLIPDRVDGFL